MRSKLYQLASFTQLSRLSGLMRRGWMWSLCLVLAIAALVWIAGPLLAINDNKFWEPASSRLVTISLLFLIWGLAMVFVSWKSTERKKAEEDDEAAQDRIRREGMIVEEQIELHGRFKAALSTLRKSSLYKGRSERWRNELPWYLLIGPQASGKTSLLDFSGLEFPLNKADQQRLTRDVAGTRYADWYFAEHGVLIDTAGRYLVQPDADVDSMGWQTLLGLLRRRRPRPLNGVLVNVPVDQLQGGTEQALETLARQTRQRLHDINQVLGVDVPVYLVLSKADKILGFDEFFDQLSREESDQVFGSSFRKDQNGTDAQVVRQEFEELLRQLNSQVIMRMHQERDNQRRGRILDFPHQLGQLGEHLCLFIELAFSGNRYQRASQLRGFYLTSAPELQHGLDSLTASIGRNLGSTKNDLPTFRNGRARFINNLLSRVVFPEADLAGLDQREVKRIGWGQRALYAAAVVCLGFFGLSWAASFSSNHDRLEQVRELAQLHTSDVQTIAVEDDALATLNALDRSYAAIQVFPPRDQAGWLQRGGLYQGGKVAPTVIRTYRNDLETLLLPRVAEQLEEQIRGSLGDRQGLLSSLRAYLMLNLQDRRDPAYLKDWLAADWSLRYAGDSEAQAALNAHFARLLNTSFTHQLDDRLVADARQQLRSESLASVVYRMLREQARNLPVYRLEQHLGPEASLLTSSSNIIPGFYTKSGYEQMFVAEGGGLVNTLLSDNWVLGGSDTLSSNDLNRLMVEMEELYFQDYSNHWADALSRLHLEPLGTILQGSLQLSRLTASSSPMLQLLTEVRKNTRFSEASQPPATLEAKVNQLQSENARKSLERRFEALHRLLDENGGPSPEMVTSLQALDALQVQLTTLAQASAPEQAAFDMARARMDGQRDAINQLRASAKLMPEPVGKWLEVIAQDSWMMILHDAHAFLNQRYRSELYAAYKDSLHQRYPFNIESESDVALADFREFFKSQGIADSFYNTYLKSFLSDASGQYRLRYIDGRGLPMSREFLKQISAVQTIRRSFFAENPNEPYIAFKLEPHSLDPSLGRANFQFGKQQMEYRHGPITQTAFHWPSGGDEGRISLQLEDLGGRRVGIEQKSGTWSLFRLLDLLEVDHHSDRDVLMLKANLSGLRTSYLLHSQRSPNPFETSVLRSFKLPTRL
ncbi:MAG TPA: type VI secretion system membrane subunit TssM [Pseudomonas xinjiangensis]|uniref:Type VI secretion system membrane subunit TssM n=2 Tax=root TaxID=1 RepID=A0A7V1BSY8_9GAMM|nr:type VI secretion system membrane subunit TssM [Halopseudomonas xinjiangensis]HEC47829.1 type VI secretion system membrane subunit TssM [Halopseudomonas xinjiangensis]